MFTDNAWIVAPTAGRKALAMDACLVSFFNANEWPKARAQKRGGDRSQLSFDAATGEQLYDREVSRDLNAEELYERAWALQFLACNRRRPKIQIRPWPGCN